MVSRFDGDGHTSGREFWIFGLFSDCISEDNIGDFDWIGSSPWTAHKGRQATFEKSLLHFVVGCSGEAEVRTSRGHITAFDLAAPKQLVLDLYNVLWVEEIGLLSKVIVLDVFG
jgi:hypothetical protein